MHYVVNYKKLVRCSKSDTADVATGTELHVRVGVLGDFDYYHYIYVYLLQKCSNKVLFNWHPHNVQTRKALNICTSEVRFLDELLIFGTPV